MSKLMLAALAQEGYSGRLGPEAIAVQLDGGKSRTRRSQLGAAATIAAQWYCTSAEYDYLMAFYRLRAAHGSEPFTIDLILESSAIVEHSATFVPNTFGLSEVRGTVHLVEAQLEVVPLAENPAADLATITAFEAGL